jgi:hypothetical protein
MSIIQPNENSNPENDLFSKQGMLEFQGRVYPSGQGYWSYQLVLESSFSI